MITVQPQFIKQLHRWLSLQRMGELDVLVVNHPLFQAQVLCQGAQLIFFAPKGQTNWLWLSDLAQFKTGESVRGGVPVCWPWFGALDKNPNAVQQQFSAAESLPAHGLVRTLEWQLTEHEFTEDSAVLNLALNTSKLGTMPKAKLGMRFVFHKHSLKIELTTHALKRMVFTEALHTYLPTTNIYETSIEGFDAANYTDALKDWSQQLQTGAVTFSKETDRLYEFDGRCQIHTPLKHYQLVSSAAHAVIWNPWKAKSKRLSQFHPQSWQFMFCVESANLLKHAVALERGQKHTLSVQLSAARRPKDPSLVFEAAKTRFH